MTVRRVCSLTGCTKPHHALGLCSYHYRRRSADGHPAAPQPRGNVKTLDSSPLVVGISYRRLDHWTRRGYLHADNPGCGSGRRRVWPESEIAVAARMKALVDIGLSVAVAARFARDDDDMTGALLAAAGVELPPVPPRVEHGGLGAKEGTPDSRALGEGCRSQPASKAVS